MLAKERYKPVGNVIEEREPLHLRELPKEDIGALLMHILHTANRLFQLFHALFRGFGMQHLFQGIFLNLFDSTFSHFELIVLHQFGQDLITKGGRIFLGIQRIDHLYLQLRQFVAHLRVAQQVTDEVVLFRIDRQIVVVNAHHPSNKGTLTYILISSMLVDMNQQTEL